MRFEPASAELAARSTATPPALTRLDAVLGDGDHGDNLVDRVPGGRGPSRRAAGRHGSRGDPDRAVGHRLVATVGGASGPLYGTAFIEAGFRAGTGRAPRSGNSSLRCSRRRPPDSPGAVAARSATRRSSTRSCRPPMRSARRSRVARPPPTPSARMIAAARDGMRSTRAARRPARACAPARRALGRPPRSRSGLVPASCSSHWRERSTARPRGRRDAAAGAAGRPRGRSSPGIRPGPARGRCAVRPVPARAADRVGRQPLGAGRRRRQRAHSACRRGRRSDLAGAPGRPGARPAARPPGPWTTRPPAQLADVADGRRYVEERPGLRLVVLGEEPPATLLVLRVGPSASSMPTASASPSLPATSWRSRSRRRSCERRSSASGTSSSAVVEGATDVILQVDEAQASRPAEPGRRAGCSASSTAEAVGRTVRRRPRLRRGGRPRRRRLPARRGHLDRACRSAIARPPIRSARRESRPRRRRLLASAVGARRSRSGRRRSCATSAPSGRSRSYAKGSSRQSATSCGRRSRSSAATRRPCSTSTSSRPSSGEYIDRIDRLTSRLGVARRPDPRHHPSPGRSAHPRARSDRVRGARRAAARRPCALRRRRPSRRRAARRDLPPSTSTRAASGGCWRISSATR